MGSEMPSIWTNQCFIDPWAIYADVCDDCMELDEITIWEYWDKSDVKRFCPHKDHDKHNNHPRILK